MGRAGSVVDERGEAARSADGGRTVRLDRPRSPHRHYAGDPGRRPRRFSIRAGRVVVGAPNRVGALRRARPERGAARRGVEGTPPAGTGARGAGEAEEGTGQAVRDDRVGFVGWAPPTVLSST